MNLHPVRPVAHARIEVGKTLQRQQRRHGFALATALALGMIGWTLWREREAVTPLLALQRFADLDARVSFRPDRVQVHLPLGRRFMDLKQGGLLEDIADVPWFDGRPLLFAQG